MTVPKISTIERWLGTGIFLVLGGMLVVFWLGWDLTARMRSRLTWHQKDQIEDGFALFVIAPLLWLGVGYVVASMA